MENELIANMRSEGRRITPARRAILETLSNSQYPLSASELHEILKKEKKQVDLVTVYRTLAALKEMGLLSQLELQEGQFRYELRQGREHHHHIRCKKCGRIADLVLCPLKKLAALVEKQTRFLVEGHMLEFSGWCPKCR